MLLKADVQQELETLIRRHTTPQQIALRARIILLACEGNNNQQIARLLDVGDEMVRYWRKRWTESQDIPLTDRALADRLADAPRPGAPARISAESYCQIMAIACQPPETFQRPITQWTQRELADEARKQGVVKTISPRQVGRFLKRSGSQTPPESLLADKPRRRP